jgi:Peptidase family M48
VLSDELLFLSPIIPLIPFAFFDLELSLSEFLLILVGLVATLELISRCILFRSGAIRLREEEAPATCGALRLEFLKQRTIFRLKPLLYWAPNDHGRGARVLGGFRSKILLTGGSVVENEDAPRKAAIILRHELSHIKSGDTRMYIYFLLWLGNALVALVQALDGGWILVQAAIGLTLSFLVYFRLLLRRREYLADAKAINLSESTGEYVDLLLGNSSPEASDRFHPTNEERAGAVTFDSPVLSTNPFIVGMSLLYVVKYSWMLSPKNGSGLTGPDSVLFFVLNGPPLAAIVLEIAKGRKIKRPLAAGEQPSARGDLRLGL